MIITHMPTRLAVVVGLVIAGALGAYYVLYLAVAPDGDWRVHQGSGHMATDGAGGLDYLVVTVEAGMRGPWFEFAALEIPSEPIKSAHQEFVLGFRARTSTGCSCRAVLRQSDGETFEHKLVLAPSTEWVRVVLPLKAFKQQRHDGSASTAGEPGASEGALTPRASALEPTATFELAGDADAKVALELTRPVLDRVASSQ